MLYIQRKKQILATLSAILIFVLCTGCSNSQQDEEYPVGSCNECQRDLYEESEYIAPLYDGIVCNRCAVEKDYKKCIGCERYYRTDWENATMRYCPECAVENAGMCCFCGIASLDFTELVQFSVDGESFYMCTECAADYFRNVEKMKPCYYCIECGHLSGGNMYPLAGWEGDAGLQVCENCLKTEGYYQCEKCGKYSHELKNGMCSTCAEDN